MKKAIFTIAFLLIAIVGFSQFNYKFNYQAVVRNGAGALVSSGTTVGMRISILEGSATGTIMYQETHSVLVNNSQGLVNLVIGNGTPTVGSMVFDAYFEDISSDKYLKVEVAPAGGSTYINMGATKLQFVPYAAHAFTSSRSHYAENGTQWITTDDNISYTSGEVNIGTSVPIGTGIMNVEKSTTDNVMQVTQTGTTGGANKSAIYGLNNATGANGIGVSGVQNGNGYGVYAKANGTSGIGVFTTGATGIKSATTATNGIAIELDGFMKVSGSKKTAFKTTALTSAASNVTLSYGGASSSDIVFVTPVSSDYVMPSWQLLWNTSTSAWQIWNASDDGSPSNFPTGTSFNILVIKQ